MTRTFGEESALSGIGTMERTPAIVTGIVITAIGGVLAVVAYDWSKNRNESRLDLNPVSGHFTDAETAGSICLSAITNRSTGVIEFAVQQSNGSWEDVSLQTGATHHIRIIGKPVMIRWSDIHGSNTQQLKSTLVRLPAPTDPTNLEARSSFRKSSKGTIMTQFDENLPSAEQSDADQPATAVDSKAEGRENLNLESEGRSQ